MMIACIAVGFSVSVYLSAGRAFGLYKMDHQDGFYFISVFGILGAVIGGCIGYKLTRSKDKIRPCKVCGKAVSPKAQTCPLCGVAEPAPKPEIELFVMGLVGATRFVITKISKSCQS